MQKRKYYSVLLFLLWSTFFVLTAAIVYLSLQDGNEAKDMMKKLIEYLGAYTDKEILSAWGDADRIEYLLRQSGRAGAFFLLGILGTSAVHLTFRRCNWLVRTILATGGLTAIAYLTEKVKEYLPTRHFSQKEMLISIAAVILGFVTVSFLTFLGWIIKGILRLLHRGESAN